jgi:hypothetical protein
LLNEKEIAQFSSSFFHFSIISKLYRSKAEMELRRKQEEVERLRLEEEDRKAALQLQAQLEKEAQEDSQFRQQLEQERRDHELALRLAQESNGQLDESPTMSRKYVYNSLNSWALSLLCTVSITAQKELRTSTCVFIQIEISIFSISLPHI